MPNVEAKVELGSVVVTATALQEIGERDIDVLPLLARHVTGDWGDVDDHDRKANEDALESGARLLSVYEVAGRWQPSAFGTSSHKLRLYIVTDAETTACGPCWTGIGTCPGGGTHEGGAHFLDGPAHRLTTTIMLPSDY